MLRESLRDHPDVASEQSTAVRRCSRICRLGGAAHDDEGDVILRHDAAQNVSHDVLGDTVGWAQTDCLSQTFETDVQYFASAFDEPVGVERDHGFRRKIDRR